MHNIIKSGLALLICTLIAGGILGLVYDVTREPIAQQEALAKAKAMNKILPNADDFQDITIDGDIQMDNYAGVTGVTRGLSNGETVGYIIASSSAGYSGQIQILVAVNNDSVIEGIEVVKQTETPGLGANATNPKFTDQYKGKSGVLSVTKSETPNDSEIQAITSSTITTTAVTKAVNEAVAFFEDNIDNFK